MCEEISPVPQYELSVTSGEPSGPSKRSVGTPSFVDVAELFHWGDWVFRGQSEESWSISSSILRESRRLVDDPFDAPRYERKTLEQVKLVSRSYPECQDLDEDDHLSWLALMQHHGCKTRLIDFTFSFYVALYFAIRDFYHDRVNDRVNADGWPFLNRRISDGVSAVWAINKRALDSKMRDLYKEMVRRYPDSRQSAVKEEELSRRLINLAIDSGNPPDGIVCCRPKKLNQRMIVQQGLFLAPLTLGPGDGLIEPALKCTSDKGEENKCDWQTLCDIIKDKRANVIKICVPQSGERQHQFLLSHLKMMNITEATLFPGFDGYARSLNYYAASEQ